MSEKEQEKPINNPEQARATTEDDVLNNWDKLVIENTTLLEQTGEESGEMYQKVKNLASQYHEGWRASRAKEDGTYEPREKRTIDDKWIERQGTNVVDIANTDFDDLPSDWQKENLDAASVAQGLLELGKKMQIDVTSDLFIERAASSIHDAWLSRHGNEDWVKGGELDVPYSELPEEEKVKDRDQILTAVALELELK